MGAEEDVAGVAHGCADMPRVDLLVQRLALAAAYGVEEIADVGLLGSISAGFSLLDQFVNGVEGLPRGVRQQQPPVLAVDNRPLRWRRDSFGLDHRRISYCRMTPG